MLHGVCYGVQKSCFIESAPAGGSRTNLNVLTPSLIALTHDVEAGDKVRIILDTGDSSDFTVTVSARDLLESRHNFFGGHCIQSLEILERDVKLPTKPGAVVGHTTAGVYVTYQLSEDEGWFRVDTTCGGAIYGASEESVLQAMRGSNKFTVLYEGRG